AYGRHYLKLHDEGAIPATLDYSIGTVSFGDELNMVFLAGEVVVDYSILLTDAFRGKSLWISAYANDVPCYIASRRILREGGYEADSSMIYYGQPHRLADEAEQLLVEQVQAMLPGAF